jgi:prepilin-type N-terminal cleavage/methylation domain-containing protein
METSNKSSGGFTLVELATVLVIVSLILAGVATGSNLIKQSELRSVISDFQKFKTAYLSFKKRHHKVPGDMDNAYAIWGAACGGSAAVCDGNSNGTVTGVYFSNTDETAAAWKHMQLDGLINYNIEAINSGYLGALIINRYTPPSTIKGAGYFIVGDQFIISDPADWTHLWTDFRTDAVFIGKQSSSAQLTVAALTAKDAYNIDNKFDDGRTDTAGNAVGFNSGKIRARDGQSIAANSCQNGTAYNVTNTAVSCIVGYELQER